MSASNLGGLPTISDGADYRSRRFAILTGDHRCYKCQTTTRVSAIGLFGFEEWDREHGDYTHVDDAVLLTGITALDGQSAGDIAEHASWMRLAFSKTADQAYLANHCQHCDSMIGAWFIKKPDEAFFPTTDEGAEKLAIIWIEHEIEVEDDGGTYASWLDRLLAKRFA